MTELPLEGRVALVTGGGRGIGRAISLALAADGAAVAVNYRRDREAAEETVAAIEALGRPVIAYQASIDSYDDDRHMVEQVIADFGHVDILVNNAGIASRGQSVEKTDPAELERVLRTHAMGPHHLVQAILPSMRERPRGDIVFISSVATLTMAAYGGPYNMAKAAMEALALTLAKEEVRHGIRVNIVAPGLVYTTMGEKLMKAVAGVEDLSVLDSSMPLGRVCRPEDVANVVRWLVGPSNTYVTGQKINVDGLASVMTR
ncbi:MAG: SDR family oxidoreductase [Acidimicrobiales bacterium]|nr:SDR family oxidoreductase [Acidimicrobiales bacterium]